MNVVELITKLVKDCTTEKDGASFCPVRIAVWGAFFALTWRFAEAHNIDPEALKSYAFAVSALLATVGFKNSTEEK